MNNQTLIGILIVLILIGGGYFLYTQAPQEEAPVNTSENQNATTTPSPKTPTGVKNYTLTEVATHNNKTSCWSTIRDGVYDLTQWIGGHPGGEQAILSICGKDGTAAFEGQHGGIQKQADVLATFKIGTLAQ